MDFETKKIPDQKLAVINFKGPIEDMDVLVAKLMGWVENDEIEIEGQPFIIYYSPRHKVNEGDAVFDVGIVVGEDSESYGEDLIRIVDLFEHEVLAGIHEGSYENIMDSYEQLVDYAQNNGLEIIGSPKEVLIKSKYNADDPESYLTEIQLPIIKK